MVVPCHLPIPTTTGQFEEYNREIGLAEFVVVEQMKDRWDKPRRFLVYTSDRLASVEDKIPLA